MLTELQADFAAGGIMFIYDNRMGEANGISRGIELGLHRRYQFTNFANNPCLKVFERRREIMWVKRIEHTLLLVLDAFLAITAMAGGIGLLTGAIAPGVALLQGSPFASYTIPGLALLILVGGCALLATGLMLRRSQWAVLTSAFAGMMIIGFELVEMLVIGSPAGVARNLQIFYLTLGLLICALAAAQWRPGHRLPLRGLSGGHRHG